MGYTLRSPNYGAPRAAESQPTNMSRSVHEQAHRSESTSPKNTPPHTRDFANFAHERGYALSTTNMEQSQHPQDTRQYHAYEPSDMKRPRLLSRGSVISQRRPQDYHRESASQRTHSTNERPQRVHDCCTLTCTGPGCLQIRRVLQDVAAELAVLSAQVKQTVSSVVEPALPPPEIRGEETVDVLTWALSLIRLNIQNMKTVLARNSPSKLESSSPRIGFASHENRSSPHQYSRSTENTPRVPIVAKADNALPPPPPGFFEERRSRIGSDTSQATQSSFYSSSNSATRPGSLSGPPTSTAQTTLTLPSPSSLNFPTSHGPLPPLLQSPSLEHSSTSSSQISDLRQQLHARTLALESLQQEHTALLTSLTHQRTQATHLQRKLTTSDSDLAALLEEKDKLATHASALQIQIDDLQLARDQARREVADSGVQYLKIVEMSSKLSGRSAQDKRRWETERRELIARIGACGCAAGQEAAEEAAKSLATTGSERKRISPPLLSAEAEHQVLVTENSRLRVRTAGLEAALRDVLSGVGRMGEVARGVLDGGEMGAGERKVVDVRPRTAPWPGRDRTLG